MFIVLALVMIEGASIFIAAMAIYKNISAEGISVVYSKKVPVSLHARRRTAEPVGFVEIAEEWERVVATRVIALCRCI